MLRVRTYFLLLGCATLLTCGKSLPKPTQEGKDTFGCKINGRGYVPTGACCSFSGGNSAPIIGGYQLSMIPFPNRPKWRVYIQAISQEEVVYLFLNNVISTGRYELNFKTETQPGNLRPLNYGSYESSKNGEYVTTPEYTGFVNITRADTVNAIVSGTFEFTAVNRRDPSKTVRITKGRFDCR